MSVTVCVPFHPGAQEGAFLGVRHISGRRKLATGLHASIWEHSGLLFYLTFVVLSHLIDTVFRIGLSSCFLNGDNSTTVVGRNPFTLPTFIILPHITLHYKSSAGTPPSLPQLLSYCRDDTPQPGQLTEEFI